MNRVYGAITHAHRPWWSFSTAEGVLICVAALVGSTLHALGALALGVLMAAALRLRRQADCNRVDHVELLARRLLRQRNTRLVDRDVSWKRYCPK